MEMTRESTTGSALQAAAEERRKQIRKKYLRGIVIAVLLLLGGAVSAYFTWDTSRVISIAVAAVCLVLAILFILYSGMTPVENDSHDLKGLSCDEVKQKLAAAGFTNLSAEGLDDLITEDLSRDGEVSDVFLGKKRKFSPKTQYPFHKKIVICYHSPRQVRIPLSSGEAKGMRREDVEQAFREAGFLLVETAAETGLFTDWKKNAGLVKRISVDGVERFEAGGKVRFTVPVRITYYESKKTPVPEGSATGEEES